MSYSDVHSFILRSVASRGVLTFKETEDALKKFPDNTQGIEEIVTDINKEIKVFKQLVKITKDEVTEEKLLVFLMLAFDDATKSQDVFSATELEFFYLLIEEIMTSNVRQISDIYLMNLVGKMKNSITETEMQRILDTFCRMHYIHKSNCEHYALGVRTIHEFEGYLRDNLPETIKECTMCKETVFRGYDCPACKMAVHTKCLSRYLRTSDKWPCCKVDLIMGCLAQNENEEVSHVGDTAEEPAQQDSDEMDVTENTPT